MGAALAYFRAQNSLIVPGRSPTTVRVVARPKADRPPLVPWPELGPGQADRLHHAREDKGWSLRDLSAASGVSVRTIRDIEAGKKGATGSDVMAALADALHGPRGWLTYGG